MIFHPRSLALVSLVPRARAIATAAHVQCSRIEVQWNTHTHGRNQGTYLIRGWMLQLGCRRCESKSNKYCIRLAIVRYCTLMHYTSSRTTWWSRLFLFFHLTYQGSPHFRRLLKASFKAVRCKCGELRWKMCISGSWYLAFWLPPFCRLWLSADIGAPFARIGPTAGASRWWSLRYSWRPSWRCWTNSGMACAGAVRRTWLHLWPQYGGPRS